MLAERYTKTIIQDKAEERYPLYTVHARKDGTGLEVSLAACLEELCHYYRAEHKF